MADRTQVVLETYVDYIDMKRHFAGIKSWSPDRAYCISGETLAKRRDVGSFIRVADKIGDDRETRKNLMMTAFLNNPKAWILDVVSKENYDEMRRRINYLRSYEESFFDEVNRYLEMCRRDSISFVDSLTVGDPLYIMDAHVRGEVCEETVAMLNYILPFLTIYTNDAAIKLRQMAIARYSPFVLSYFNNCYAIKEAIHETLIDQH